VSNIGTKATVRVDTHKTASVHDLRRAFGERWASRLMPAQLMELMRYESIEMTLSYYVGRNAERTAAILWHGQPTQHRWDFVRPAPNSAPNSWLFCSPHRGAARLQTPLYGQLSRVPEEGLEPTRPCGQRILSPI